MTITANDLPAILAEHRMWLRGEGGKRADLTDADLMGANLGGADLTDADLTDADLTGASLTGADLTDASLTGAKVKGAPQRRATRSDGYEFFLWDTNQGWRIRAGCRFFDMEKAEEHWSETRPRGTPLGDETHDILDFFRAHIARVEAQA